MEEGEAMPRLIFDEDKCKGCKLCTSVCPKNLVVMSEDKINAKGFHPASITNQEECIGCAFCATICPDCVIKIVKE